MPDDPQDLAEKKAEDPSPDETRKAIRTVVDLACSLVPAHARPYVIPALVGAGFATGVNVLDTAFEFLGVATASDLHQQEESIDALIDAFRRAHPDVPVEVLGDEPDSPK